MRKESWTAPHIYQAPSRYLALPRQHEAERSKDRRAAEAADRSIWISQSQQRSWNSSGNSRGPSGVRGCGEIRQRTVFSVFLPSLPAEAPQEALTQAV